MEIPERLESDQLPILSSVKPVMIMDRGIATKDNIALLVERGYPYTVIERRAVHNDYTEEFEDLSSFEQIGNGEETVYLKKISHETGVRVLCCSYKRQQKELSMDRKKETRFLQTLASIQRQIGKVGKNNLPDKST